MSETPAAPKGADDPERTFPLAPLDEAVLVAAHTRYEIVNAVVDDLPRSGREDASVLADALYVQSLADRLVREAVVVECERGASWAAIGQMTGVSRQSAHERWSPVIEGWALTGRQRTGIGSGTPSAELAANLDAWFAELDHQGRTDAITATLPSYADSSARTAAQEKREQAAQLRDRQQALQQAADQACQASMAATGTAGADHNRTAWATALLARAGTYDQLAAAEAPLGREHKRTAGRHRSLAHDLLSGKPVPATAPTTETGT
ncbi:hypothetical protein [Streptomyces sp. NPDC029674]|uniref:hypothetical protein n=1 Tax=Streptomyces sp. NPDC029674 TaxID=3365297 RepID=UPI00384D5C4A